MTVPQFKYLLQPGEILDSVDRTVNICYTGSNIQAIAVRIGENTLTRLQQATAIVLRAPEAGNSLNISLESTLDPLRTVDREQVGSYYVYTFVEQSQQPVMSETPSPTGSPLVEYYYTNIIIIPSPDQQGFQGSEYDVLLNNSMENRLSEYIQVSDRAERTGLGTNPINLPNILANTANPAHIQDSSYSNTGWSNARYNGSITSGLTFGGVTPSINGSIFEGVEFPITLTSLEIQNIVAQGVSYTQYLHNSKEAYPTFESKRLRYGAYTLISPSQSYIELDSSGGGPPHIFTQGDIIAFSATEDTLGNTREEFMKVLSFSNEGGSVGTVYVERGWGGSITREVGNLEVMHLITPIQVFKLDGNRIQGVGSTKMYIRESGDIQAVNTVGYIVTGSISPT